ncbi:MAG: TetR family transcriptional regulator [Ornithinimicrobium sp.]
MRSADEDITGKAAIRNAALSLFAEHGPDAVSVRAIAAAAGVSPALILHHFGSKNGLKEAVGAYVIGLLDDLSRQQSPADVQASAAGDASKTDSMMANMVTAFPADSPVLPYLRRLLMSNDELSHSMLRHWYDLAVQTLAEWEEMGIIEPSPDREVRAAFMLSVDIGALLLRDQFAEFVGTDLLSPEGLPRWAAESLRMYGPLFTVPLSTEGTP